MTVRSQQRTRIGIGEVTASEKHQSLQDRADYGNGTYRLVLFCHSAADDWNSLVESTQPGWLDAQHSNALLANAIVATERYVMVSTEHTALDGVGLGWGSVSSTGKLNTARTWGQTDHAGNWAVGMGAKTGKVALIGLSHGAATVMNYVRSYPANVLGCVLLHGAVNLSRMRTANSVFKASMESSYATELGLTPPFTDPQWNSQAAPVHDPLVFGAGLATKPPVAMWGNHDDTTCVWLTDQVAFAAAYGASITDTGTGDHNTGNYARAPYLSQIIAFLDGLAW